MTDWQPIETAPKDGTRILAVCAKAADRSLAKRDGHISVDFWHTMAIDGIEGWGAFNTHYWPPTHWQPLPAPPIEAGTRQ